MNNIKKHSAFAVNTASAVMILVLLMTALTACEHFFHPPVAVYTPGEGSGRAVIRLSIPEARTIMPSFTFAEYEISFVYNGSDNTVDVPSPLTISGGSSSAQATLASGSWTITAKGKVNIGGDLKTVAQGSSTVNIIAGQNNSVNIRLSARMEGDNGTLSYNKDEFLGWAVNSASITVTSLADASIHTANLLNPNTSYNPGFFSLAPGYYLVLIRVTLTATTGATITEVAHIHPGLTTTIPFTKDHFDFGAMYDITITTAANGTITSNPSDSAPVGSTVTLMVHPGTGYALTANSLKVQYGNNQTIIPDHTGAGIFTFIMPAYNVTISAAFGEPNAIPENWEETIFLGGSFNGLGASGGVFNVNQLVEPEAGRSARSARSAIDRTDALVPLLGSIQDDGKNFELTGFMDPDTRQFFIGGGKEDLVYSITGSMDTSGQLEISFIDIRQKDPIDGEWDAKELPFTRNDFTPPPPRPVRPTEVGIPSFFWGKWGDEPTIPTCSTCGAPLPCPQGHLGCPCDNGSYCLEHTVCDDCGPNGQPACPLHCQMCRNGQWCFNHPCPDCGEWGFPQCPAHCSMCRHDPVNCPEHGSGGGGDRPGTGDDRPRAAVITKMLLQNASRSVNTANAARSVASRSIMPANAEDQDSFLISQFGISKSRPWMNFLYKHADDFYNQWQEYAFSPYAGKYWYRIEDLNFYNAGGAGGRSDDLMEMETIAVFAHMFGYPNVNSYLNAMQARFRDEAEIQVKADDVNFLESWQEDDVYYILGYKKEVGSSVFDPPTEGYDDFIKAGWDAYEEDCLEMWYVVKAANEAIDELLWKLNGYKINSGTYGDGTPFAFNHLMDTYELNDYLRYVHAVESYGNTGSWEGHWGEVITGQAPTKDYFWDEYGGRPPRTSNWEWDFDWELPEMMGKKVIPGTISATGSVSLLAPGELIKLGYNTPKETAELNFRWMFMRPVSEMPKLEYRGRTFMAYRNEIYFVGDNGVYNTGDLYDFIRNDPSYRSVYFTDNVYVKIALTVGNDGTVSMVEKDAFAWEVTQVPAPEAPWWWDPEVWGVWDMPDSGMVDRWELVKKSVYEVKAMVFEWLDFWMGRKIARW